MRKLFALALLPVLSVAAVPAAAQPAAKDLMQQINARYAELLNEPRVVTVEQTSTLRSLGTPDVTTTSSFIAHQKGKKARMVLVDSRLEARQGVESTRAALRHVWVHDGETTKVLFESAPHLLTGETTVVAKTLDHSRIPESAGPDFRSPLESLELHDVFLEADFTVHEEIYDGTEVYVLSNVRPFEVNDDTTMLAVEIWVARPTLEIVHSEVRMRYRGGEGETATDVIIDNVQDFKTIWGVEIPEGTFTLQLPPGAEDITPLAVEAARAASQ